MVKICVFLRLKTPLSQTVIFNSSITKSFLKQKKCQPYIANIYFDNSPVPYRCLFYLFFSSILFFSAGPAAVSVIKYDIKSRTSLCFRKCIHRLVCLRARNLSFDFAGNPPCGCYEEINYTFLYTVQYESMECAEGDGCVGSERTPVITNQLSHSSFKSNQCRTYKCWWSCSGSFLCRLLEVNIFEQTVTTGGHSPRPSLPVIYRVSQQHCNDTCTVCFGSKHYSSHLPNMQRNDDNDWHKLGMGRIHFFTAQRPDLDKRISWQCAMHHLLKRVAQGGNAHSKAIFPSVRQEDW